MKISENTSVVNANKKYGIVIIVAVAMGIFAYRNTAKLTSLETSRERFRK